MKPKTSPTCAPQEPRDALEIFTVRMPLIFDSCLADPALLLCVRRLMDFRREEANRVPCLQDVSRGFAETLVGFLVSKKLDELEVSNIEVDGCCLLLNFCHRP